MPSLRRSVSVPSVSRSSPYPSAASLARSVRAGGHGPRRFTGSETSNRRVLADIEWWKVCSNPGEMPGDVEEHGQEEEDQVDLSIVSQVQDDVERPYSGSSGSLPEDPVATPFAALSIAPSTPERRTRHSMEGSWSSLDSTQDGSEAPVEISRLGGTPSTPVRDSDVVVVQGLTRVPNLRRGRAVPRPVRSYSLTDMMTLTSSRAYADFTLSPLSPTRANGLAN